MNNLPSLSWATPPSTLKGAARLADMFGKLDEYQKSDRVDLELINKDWEIVGNDIELSLERYEQEKETLLG